MPRLLFGGSNQHSKGTNMLVLYTMVNSDRDVYDLYVRRGNSLYWVAGFLPGYENNKYYLTGVYRDIMQDFNPYETITLIQYHDVKVVK